MNKIIGWFSGGVTSIDDVSFLKNRLFTDSTVEAL
jgi:hypothetical protein